MNRQSTYSEVFERLQVNKVGDSRRRVFIAADEEELFAELEAAKTIVASIDILLHRLYPDLLEHVHQKTIIWNEAPCVIKKK